MAIGVGGTGQGGGRSGDGGRFGVRIGISDSSGGGG